MTDRTDVVRGRDIVARWCGLAEQRLDYLTELFETGRWRRYHSEIAFLENIREARSAVETWRDMLTAEATRDNLPVDLSWIGRHSTVPPARREVPAEPIAEVAAQPVELSVAAEFAELPVAPAVSVVPEEAEAEKVAAEEIEAAAGEAAAAEAEAAEAEEVEAGSVLVLDPINPAQESALEKTLALTLDIVGKAGRYPSLRNAFQQSGNS